MDTTGKPLEDDLLPNKWIQVIPGVFGLITLVIVMVYVLSLRKNPSTNAAFIISGILGSMSALLWITKSLSKKAGFWIERMLRRLLPFGDRICFLVTKFVGAAIFIILSLLVGTLLNNYFYGSIPLEQNTKFYYILGVQALIYYPACALLGLLSTILMKLSSLPKKLHIFNDDIGRKYSWGTIWLFFTVLYALFFGYFLILFLPALCALIGGILFYGLMRISRGILLSPISAGAAVSSVADGPSLTLGVVWITGLSSSVIFLIGIIGEYL